MTWWMWVVLGIALLAAEMAIAGGFFAFFFGLAALLVGILSALGLAGGDALQWLLFSVLSVLGVALFRRPVMRAFKMDQPQPRVVDGLVGEDAVILEDVAPGSVGKAELRGTTWSARSTSAQALVKGQRCKVERVEGLTLWIRA